MPTQPRVHPLLPALLLVAVITLARVVYLIALCDYQLVEDEAHYWLWSKFLDWSYYSKGPGVALAIAASTRILGDAEWAVRLPTALLSGLGLAAVALLLFTMSRASSPSPREGAGGAGGGLASAVQSLPNDKPSNSPLSSPSPREGAGGAGGGLASANQSLPPSSIIHLASPSRVAFAAVLSLLFAPAIQAVSVLMTIDGPYIACWAIACLSAWLAFTRSSKLAWLALGASLAAGFLFKYTILLLVPGLVLFLVLARTKLPPLKPQRAFIILSLLLALLGLAPVLIWNSQHDWATFKHLLGHLGLQGGDVPLSPSSSSAPKDQWSPTWSLELIAQQLGMIGPILVLGALAARRALQRRPKPAPSLPPHAPHPPHSLRWTAELFLICAAAPILLFYLAVSFIAEPEGNWPIAAYVTLLPLGAWHAADALAARRAARLTHQPLPRADRPIRWLWRTSIWYALIAALLIHFAGNVASSLNRLAATATFRSTFQSLLGREPHPIVLGRLYGAREMARDLDSLLTPLQQEPHTPPPFILAQHYGRASQMAYYFHTDPLINLPSKPPRPAPEVFCAMPQTGGRKSQFDLWPHTSLARPDLAGRSAIILSNNRPETLAVWNRMFQSVELIPSQQLAGEHKPDRFAYIARGYRPEAATPAPRSTSSAAPSKDAP